MPHNISMFIPYKLMLNACTRRTRIFRSSTVEPQTTCHPHHFSCQWNTASEMCPHRISRPQIKLVWVHHHWHGQKANLLAWQSDQGSWHPALCPPRFYLNSFLQHSAQTLNPLPVFSNELLPFQPSCALCSVLLFKYGEDGIQTWGILFSVQHGWEQWAWLGCSLHRSLIAVTSVWLQK